MAVLNNAIKIRGTEEAIITCGAVEYPVHTAGDITLTPEIISGTMSGEQGMKIDQFAFMTGQCTFDIPQMLLDMKLWGVLTGNTPTEAGATPNQTTTLDFKAGQCHNSFTLKFNSSCVGNTTGYGTGNTPAQVEFQFYNVMFTGLPIAIPQAEFMSVTASYQAVASKSTQKFLSIVLRETAV
ncbi:MAG: hypothetical protein PHS68_07270 [Candidatus Izemoplasmatales bacterium]|nr:hypothetical protein [Candidatus Izemoplasmatales bacterium]